MCSGGIFEDTNFIKNIHNIVILGHGKRTMDTFKNYNGASNKDSTADELLDIDSTAYLLSLLKEKYGIE